MKSDWNIPDWRDEKNYPDLKNSWAWQFLRRNPEYRKLWVEQLQVAVDTQSKVVPVMVFEERFGAFQDPGIGDSPGIIGVKYQSGQSINRWKKALGQKFTGSIHMRDNEVSVVFNVEMPLGPQFEVAKLELLKFRRQLGLKEERKRPRTELYSRYLRVLDADEINASDREIASILFPKKKNFYPEEEGSKAVRNARSAARKLRDFDYRYLAQAESAMIANQLMKKSVWTK